MSSAVLPRKLIILALVLPVAAYVGFQLADPDYETLKKVALLVGLLCVPLILKWHHPMLIFCWNLPMMFFFLPGSPHLWMLMSFISLGISVVGTILDKDQKLMHVPIMTWAMIGLVLVVLFTMKMTGSGLGLRAFGGSTYGAKKYFFILFAVVGYFAISCRRFPAAKADGYIGMLVLPGVATGLSNLIYVLGPGLWFLYAMFPVDWALGQAMEDFSLNATSVKIGRIGGLAVVGQTLFSYMLARFGIRGVFEFTKPWRLAVFAVVSVFGLLGGFRSVLVTYVCMLAIQFFLEGLHKTRLLPSMLALGVVGFLLLIPLAGRLPLPVQRCLSVLPLDVDPVVKADALGSIEWRKQMWTVLLPEIPKHFWVGKGYTASSADYYLTQHAMRLGFLKDFEGSLLAGDYHNGPLSVLIPFGIWGLLAFLFFIGASLHVLINNYRNGDSAIQRINTFLLATFLTCLLLFTVLFGAVHLDIAVFAGLVAFSISLNGGVRRKRTALAPVPAGQDAKPAVVRARPVFARS